MKCRYLIIASAIMLSACNTSTQPQVAASSRSTSAPTGCPASMDAMACDYYKDGIKAGKTDKAAHMSDAYQRHQDQYDSRFEAPFRAGYATGWYNDGK